MKWRMFARAAHMSAPEILHRGTAAGRIGLDRVRLAMRQSWWDRRKLRRALANRRDLAGVRAALDDERWRDAHRALSEHFAATGRFVILPLARDTVAKAILTEFPNARHQALATADRLLAGTYDLLGYDGLRFSAAPNQPDWQYDPVHDRRPPTRFWTSVPFLDPACGDHKIIWELNRHQHWLALGRAYWLSGQVRYRDLALQQLASWLHANPPLIGVNWASMLELGLRCLSWLWALNFFVNPDIDDDPQPWTVDLLLGLDRQLTQIERNLSFYFSPNTHLLGEALALYIAGRVLPELAASGRRETTGRRVLLDQIDRQIAADGGHVERSTHYHRYTLDFYLLALAVARITHDPAATRFDKAVGRLAFAARLLADDRGRLPRIGDDDAGALIPICGRPTDDVRDSLAIAGALTARADLRIGRVPEETFWVLGHPLLRPSLELSRTLPAHSAIGSAALPTTGYYVSRSAAGDHMVIDGGPHGYRNGGHAHADALSLTLTVHGIPLLIDAGTGTYTMDASLRDRLRSTELHNTVVIDDRPQSIPDGPFHWSRTAGATVRRWRTNGAFDYFDGVHDGYHPLEHRRHVLALHGDLIVVLDLVDGTGPHSAAVHWHIDPRWRVDVRDRRAALTTDGGQAELAAPHGVIEWFYGDDGARLGWHAPEYGRVEPATTVRISDRATAPMWLVTAIGLNPENPVAEVETVPVWAEAGILGRSVAVRVRREASVDYVMLAHPLEAGDTMWRVAEFETDAHVMFCRIDAHRHVTRVALVDGSRMRTTGRRRVHIGLPRQVPDLHVDLGETAADTFSGAEAHVSGPGFGAQIVVGGREVPLAIERRSAPRTTA
jgi:hypothetical protein